MLLLADTLAGMAPEHDSPPSPGAGQAAAAGDRTQFEEEALTHAEHLYRIALRLTGSSQTAEDLVQETYLRAFRAWRSYTPGTNLAAWLATIMRNANMDELRRQSRRPPSEPLDEQGDYYLYNRLADTGREPQERVLARLSGSGVVDALESCRRTSARWSCWWTSASSPMPTPPRSSGSRSGRSCRVSTAAGAS